MDGDHAARIRQHAGDVVWPEYAEAKALLILQARNSLHEALSVDEVEDCREEFNIMVKARKQVSGGEVTVLIPSAPVLDSGESEPLCESFRDSKGDVGMGESFKGAERGGATATISQAQTYYLDRAVNDTGPFHRRTEEGKAKLVDRQMSKLFGADFMKEAPSEVMFRDFLRAEASSIITKRYMPDESAIMSVDSAFSNKIVEGGALDGTLLVLNEDQVEHARIKFEDWDVDGNGSLSVKELCRSVKDLNIKCSQVEFKKKMRKVFKQADTDNDKSLTFEEFLPVYNLLFLSNVSFDDF